MDHKLVYDPPMPHVSRYRLSKKTETYIVDTLDLVLSKLTEQQTTTNFLLALLTPTERVMLAKRFAIIILLEEGFSESHISQTLHVTRVTVSRMQLFMEARGQGFSPAFQIIKHEKHLQELKNLLINLAAYTARAAGGRVKPTIF